MRLCIIAGGGELPQEILKRATLEKKFTSVICIKGEATPKNFLEANNSIEISIGKIGKATKFLEENNISHIVFAGSVQRPSLASISVDLEGAKLLALLLKEKFLGDDNLLKITIQYFEKKGFTILAPSDFLKATKKGALTNSKPNKQALEDINVAKSAFKKIGTLDVGQSLIVSEKRIIAIEGAEGTDNMICRSKNYINNHAVLLKLPKPGQETRIDMPTIGPKTIDIMHKSNLSGLVINKNVIVISEKETIDKANSLGIYIYVI